MTELKQYFPVWDKLTEAEQQRLCAASSHRSVKKGTVISGNGQNCTGLYLVEAGQLRAHIVSDEGREITLYRLFEQDICLFSASCMMNSIQFDIVIEAEKDSELIVIRPDEYKALMGESAPLANYTSEVMASRFSEVMWLIEQIMWKSFDKRLAAFLLEEAAIEGDLLTTTHETIANHLGTAREVVTRMLRYFQSEGMVKLSRKTVELTDKKRLAALSE